MAIIEGYYIYKGFVPKSQLLSEGVNIKRLPTQADQKYGRLWIRPGNEADLVKPSAIVDTISGKRFPYGGAVFKWPLMGLSPNMVKYLHETYFDYNWYAELTVQTFNRANGDWEAYWVTARWPDYASEAELSAGGYSNFQINFVNGVLAPDGTDLSIDGFATGNFQIGSHGTFNLEVSNAGDSVNFDPIYIDYAVPDDLVYENFAGEDWELLWSEDGITYYEIADDPPPEEEDVRFIRLRYVYELPVAGTITASVDLRPDVPGSSSSTFTVSTAGDNGTDNKEIEFIVEVEGAPFSSGFSAGFGPSETGFNAGFQNGSFGVTPLAFNEGFDTGFGS